MPLVFDRYPHDPEIALDPHGDPEHNRRRAMWYAACSMRHAASMVERKSEEDGGIPYFGENLWETITRYEMPDGTVTRDREEAMLAWMRVARAEGFSVHPDWADKL